MKYQSGNSRKGRVRCFLVVCAIVIHGVGSAQLVVDAIGSELVSDHTGGYLGTGVSFADFNGDGLDDLTFGHHDGALSFYAGNGDGFDPIDLGLELPIAEAKGVLWADIDNDGDHDLFVAYRFAPNKLWLNDGEMGFEDVSSSCGIAQDNRRSFGPAFGDFDRDGLLDLFVANYGYAVDVPQGNELYRNVGGGQFEDVTAEFGLDGENLQSFQATWMDVDRDGWLDLHVIRDRLIFPNLFYHNKAEEQGAVWFEEEAQARGMDAMLNCMSSSPHDYDRDGDLDLFIAGGLEGNMLLVNNGDGYYTDATNDLVQMNEVCWSGQWLDVDADGWEELHVATGFANYTNYPQVLFQFSDEPDALFQNDAGNLLEAGELYQSESALAFATVTGDYDGDGFVDFISHQVGPHPEVRRSIPNGNAGMRILLHGTASNADAIGSKIELWAGADYWYRETHCGEGYLAQNSRWEHFGLANHTTVDSIKVHWPLGTVETWHDVQVQATLELTEGSACAPECAGCTYDGACNYDPDAFIDDGSCDFSCLIEQSVCGEGLMWDATAAQCVPSCAADFNGDDLVGVEDLLLLLQAFAVPCPD